MTDGQDDFVTIRPRRIDTPAGGAVAPARVDAPSPAPARGRHGPIALIAGLLAILVCVVWLLPKFVTPPRVDDIAATLPAPDSRAREAKEQAAAPFASLRHERERKHAESMLQRFVELQIRLDDEMGVDRWAGEEFAAAQAMANEGDAHFVGERFEAAFERYQSGIAALEALVARGDAKFDAALARALEAIARGQPDVALAALDEAALVHPQDPRIRDARTRLERAPRIAELRARGDAALAAGAFNEAADAYAQALALDGSQTDLAAAVERARARAADEAFAALVSEGYAALDAGRLDDAKRAFGAALARRPNDPAAADGLAQVAQSGTLSRIERVRRAAERHEAAEDWAAAERAYAEALAVDATLKFAADGRARAVARAELDRALESALADTGRLSNDAAFAETVALYERAAAVPSAGPRLTGQVDRLEAALAIASKPVPVVLTSDAATDVTVYQLGPIGRFERKEVSLRPGRYLVTGSRRGCRDVRLEVEVRPSMPPVDVRCQESL
jgi:tetratricopeptide (TPR) repeat protein